MSIWYTSLKQQFSAVRGRIIPAVTVGGAWVWWDFTRAASTWITGNKFTWPLHCSHIIDLDVTLYWTLTLKALQIWTRNENSSTRIHQKHKGPRCGTFSLRKACRGHAKKVFAPSQLIKYLTNMALASITLCSLGHTWNTSTDNWHKYWEITKFSWNLHTTKKSSYKQFHH